MGVLDAPLGNVARILVGTFGRAATLVVPGTGGGYNPDTGNIEASGDATETPCSVVFDDSQISRGESGLFDRSLVQEGDRVGILSRLQIGTTPVQGRHHLVEGGRTWRIIAVRSYSTGSQEAAFSLLLRR